MHIKTPISSTENPIFMLLILINETYALIPIVGSFLTIFTSGFQTCSFYNQFWQNKNEHKNHIIKIKEGEEEDVGF